MGRKRDLLTYIVFDFISAAGAWAAFYYSRKAYIESPKFGIKVPVEIDSAFIAGLILIPVFWLLFYYTTGYYKNILRKSRLNDVGHTLITTILGSVFIFFFIILDDVILDYTDYYLSIGLLMLFHFGFTLFFRLIITTYLAIQVHKLKIQIPTLIIGGGAEAMNVYKEITSYRKPSGNKFVGFVMVNHSDNILSSCLTHLGSIHELNEHIAQHKVDEVIIANEPGDNNKIEQILDKLDFTDVSIKASSSLYENLKGKTRIYTLFGTSLIQVENDIMPSWQQHVKYLIDVILASIFMILLAPAYFAIMLGVKLSSKGPIFFRQERIGKYGKPFVLYKFRSMCVNAESEGPQLAKKNDNRLTRIGKFLRKTKLDEIPNFFNVIKGDMSLVGPRPERQFYINQIVKRAPHYMHLLKVKPGITSLGQVKYGYAENVDQMIRRLRYDIIYIENMSIYLDLKILFYTFVTICKGRGV